MSLVEVLKRVGENTGSNGDGLSTLIGGISFLAIAGAFMYWNYKKSQGAILGVSEEPFKVPSEQKLPYREDEGFDNYLIY